MRAAVAVLALLVTVGAATGQQQTADFTGRVFDASSKVGIQNLQVKLVPPKQSKVPARISNTDRDGAFVFKQVPRGRYLLEVSQGLILLYRAEVNTATTPRVEVALKQK